MAKDFEYTIKGQLEVERRMRTARNGLLKNLNDAVGITATQVAKHAKADHRKGFAHAVGRYANQTTNLTNSIVPHLVRFDDNAIQYDVYAHREYAAFVEFGTANSAAYPFMFPALTSQKEEFPRRLAAFGFKEIK